MLKVSEEDKKVRNQLLSKSIEIVITNVCNLNCGGCCQLVGHFRKDQLWFISLEELEKAIQLAKKYSANKPITIFGGEPTLHPDWNKIVSILKSHAPSIFWINTNGRLGHQRYQKEDNLVWWVDLHPDSQLFVQTLHAAADVITLPNDMAYWEKAQKDCPIWNGCQCSIYKDKAYFCENAAALDWLYYDGKHGWEIESGKNPFNKTKAEIDEQAKHVCKRCGWCVTDLIPRQLSKNPSYVSPLNQVKGKKTKHSLTVLDNVVTQRWIKLNELFINSWPSIGVFRIHGEQRYPSTIKENDLSKWVNVHEAINKQGALKRGKQKYDWTIILEPNYIIPYNSIATLIKWITLENSKPVCRSHFSIPVYDLPVSKYDPDMLEPNCFAKSVVIGFSKSSEEAYDDEIFSRLGHRRPTEGAGITSLWHDKLTDIVGGVVNLY